MSTTLMLLTVGALVVYGVLPLDSAEARGVAYGIMAILVAIIQGEPLIDWGRNLFGQGAEGEASSEAMTGQGLAPEFGPAFVVRSGAHPVQASAAPGAGGAVTSATPVHTSGSSSGRTCRAG